MKKILFITYGGGHVQITIPVIKELRERNFDIQVLALTTSIFPLETNNIKYKKIKDYLDIFLDKKEILEIGSSFINDNYNEESGLDKEEILSYIGMNLYDLKLQCGTLEPVKHMFEKEGRKIFYPYHTMKKIIQFEQPDIVFLTCGQRAEKAAGIVAEELNIPIVRIVDLMGENINIPYKAKVLVINEIVKKNLLKNNRHLLADDIIVSGQPNIGVKPDNNELDLFIKMYDVDKYKNIISMFSQPGINGRDKLAKELIKYAENDSKSLYFYKLHPNEDVNYYLDSVKKLPTNFIFCKDIDLISILYYSDVVITFFSTVGLQAISMDKPLITINLTNEKYDLDYSKYNCSIEVNEIKNLQNIISRLLDESDDLNSILTNGRKDMMIPDNAAKNIVELISRI